MAQFQRALRDRLYAEWETTLACPNGTRVEVWVAGEPILHEGQAVAVYCTVKDITGRKQSEAALRQAKDELARANESLEQRVQERTAALRETVDELERYTYSIAHDMRQPLRSMRMFSQWLQEEHTSGLSSEGCDYLRRIEQAAARMDSLVVDVLSYSQVSRMELRREDVDLTSLVRQIVHEYFDSAGQESIEVVAPLTPVHANMALLTQILANLLGNALKFVAPGVKPRVLVYTERREGRVRLTVEDNGIGIAEADRARIWEIFGKVHHRDQYEGTGIGLSIVRKAVERMGGVVGVDSEPGKGTRFWFELPPSETAG
jgi:signal transduction histidine kinase